MKDLFNLGNIYNTSKAKPKRQPIGKQQKSAVRIIQKGRCKDCHKVLIVEEYHHIKHVANNGKSITRNLVALCPECHRKRHIKEGARKQDSKKRKTKSRQDFGILGVNPNKNNKGLWGLQ